MEVIMMMALIHGACNILFTIHMPMSTDLASLAGGSIVLSGYLISIYGLGVLASFPIVFCFGCHRVKTCIVIHTILAIMGGLVFAISVATGLQGSHLLWCILFARFVLGVAAGINYIGSLVITR